MRTTTMARAEEVRLARQARYDKMLHDVVWCDEQFIAELGNYGIDCEAIWAAKRQIERRFRKLVSA